MSDNFIHTIAVSPGIESLPMTETSALRKISTGEVLVVAIVALAMYTGLLLRLPYRSVPLNSLLSGSALISLYLYLKLGLQIRLPVKLLFCLLFAIVIDMIGNQFGLFSKRILAIPYDTITHFLSSGLSFIAVMWLLMKLIKRFDFSLPLGWITFFSVTTTFSLGAYYEITELMDERFFGGHRIWTPRDTVQDLAADLSGIIVAAICYTLVVRKQRHQHSRKPPIGGSA